MTAHRRRRIATQELKQVRYLGLGRRRGVQMAASVQDLAHEFGAPVLDVRRSVVVSDHSW
jgi:hypothetical protein